MEPLTLAELRDLEQDIKDGNPWGDAGALRAVRELIALRCSKITIRADVTPEEFEKLREEMLKPGEIYSVPTEDAALRARYERLRKAAEAYMLTEPHNDGEAAYGEEYYRRLEALRAALGEEEGK